MKLEKNLKLLKIKIFLYSNFTPILSEVEKQGFEHLAKLSMKFSLLYVFSLLRINKHAIVATTSPYTKYQYGEIFGVGRRIAMEIKIAQEDDVLDKIIT